MTRLEELERQNKIERKDHRFEKVNGREICIDCKVGLWDSKLPHFCEGKLIALSPAVIDTKYFYLNLSCKINATKEKIELTLCSEKDEIDIETTPEELEKFRDYLDEVIKKYTDIEKGV